MAPADHGVQQRGRCWVSQFSAALNTHHTLLYPAHNGTYGALVLYPWVVSGGIDPVAPCLLLGFRAV
jgi:hypothetical protein